MLLSLRTTPRARSGSKRIREETVLSVLKNKEGLVWLESASTRALIRSCWCCSMFISTRVLLQILMGTEMAITVARTAGANSQTWRTSTTKSQEGLVACTSATCAISRQTEAIKGSISQESCTWRNNRKTARGILRNVNGPKFQISSLLGMAWRINPPSKPAKAAEE